MSVIQQSILIRRWKPWQTILLFGVLQSTLTGFGVLFDLLTGVGMFFI